MVLFLCKAFFFINVAYVTFALYEDQAGKFDWRQQYVGGINEIHYDPYGQTGKRITVSTEKNVLASISVKTGEIGWRQIFENGQAGHIDDIVQSSNNIVVALNGGMFVRSFSATVGNLQWEVPGEAMHAGHIAQLALLQDATDQIAVLSSDSVTLRKLDNGQEQWTTTLPDSSKVNYKWLFSESTNIYAIGIVDNNRAVVIKIDDSGIKGPASNIPATWISGKTECEILSPHLICIDEKTSTIQALSILQPKAFKSSVLSGVKWPSDQAFSLSKLQTYSQVEEQLLILRMSDNHQILLKIDSKDSVSVKHEFHKVSAVQLVSVGETSVLVTVSRINHENIEILSYDYEDPDRLVQDFSGDATYNEHHGPIRAINGLVYRKRDGGNGVRFIVTAEDQSISLIQLPGKIMWCREESLSSVLSVEMLDLPVSDIQAQMQDEFGSQKNDILSMFVNRFTTQYHQLKDYIMHLRHRLKTPRTSGYHDDDVITEQGDDYMTRDDFNLHKMIVIVTAAGKLYGIDSATGSMFWRVFLPDFQPFRHLNKDVAPLYVQRTTSHFPRAPQCVVLGKNKISGQSVSYTFNPMTGVATQAESDADTSNRHSVMTYDYDILQVTLAAQMDKQFIKPLVILDTDLKVHIYPDTDADTLAEITQTLYLHTSNVETGVMNGYQISEHGTGLKAKSLWRVNLNKDENTITNIVPKRSLEHVHSQGIVLADRSVMYKYLNPNLMVVTTEGTDSAKKPFVNIYLIDAVSGHIVFHCSHKRTHGPLKIVHSENWVVYMYWNERHRRSEVSAIEMYEGRNQGNATAFSSVHPPNAPIVMRQAYIFNNHASSMAATITEKGITTKHIMVALESGGILELPKAFVDPRRPVPIDGKLDTSYREEGIMPYMPELPYSYEAIVNYNHSVYNIHGIHTAPAGLESTCLVLCYGLDLFYTRVMPSKMFDVLKDDFDYLFILSVLAAMIGVSFVSQKLAARKAMKRAWR